MAAHNVEDSIQHAGGRGEGRHGDAGFLCPGTRCGVRRPAQTKAQGTYWQSNRRAVLSLSAKAAGLVLGLLDEAGLAEARSAGGQERSYRDKIKLGSHRLFFRPSEVDLSRWAGPRCRRGSARHPRTDSPSLRGRIPLRKAGTCRLGKHAGGPELIGSDVEWRGSRVWTSIAIAIGGRQIERRRATHVVSVRAGELDRAIPNHDGHDLPRAALLQTIEHAEGFRRVIADLWVLPLVNYIMTALVCWVSVSLLFVLFPRTKRADGSPVIPSQGQLAPETSK